jgi:quinol monooxygenase YgiN
MSGYLEFPPDQRDQTLAALQDICIRSRQDPGCIDYWWAEDVEHPDRFRFFECWDTVEDFDAHQAQPYEAKFMEQHVSRVTVSTPMCSISASGARCSRVEPMEQDFVRAGRRR